MFLVRVIAIVLVLFAAAACTKKQAESPVAVLEQYIQVAMNAKVYADKTKLVDLTMGPAKDLLEQMTESEFNEQFLQQKFKFQGFKAKDLREESSGDISVVYELNFEESTAGGAAAEMSNKKIAFLGKDERGHWKIKETKNVKSFVEQKNAMEISGSKAATPGSTDKAGR